MEPSRDSFYSFFAGKQCKNPDTFFVKRVEASFANLNLPHSD